MNRFLLAGAAALALAACSGEGDEQRAPDQTMAPVNEVQDAAAAATGLATAARGALSTTDYVTAAAIADMYEIESSTMALGRSQNAEIKRVAQMIIDDHKKSTAELKSLVANMDGVTLPTAMDQRRQGLIDNLRGASANDFDDEYLDQQTAAHHEAEALHRGYGEAGENAALKAFGTKTADVVKGHTEMVTRLDRGTNADDESGQNSPGVNGAGAVSSSAAS